MIQKLAERVSSGVTSGVATGGSGGSGKDPLKGVDVAGLEEINIAEKDWQSIFRQVLGWRERWGDGFFLPRWRDLTS